MAKTYQDEMQTEMDSIKVSQKKIDDRYDKKFDLLGEKINKLSKSFKKLNKKSAQSRADTDVMLEDLRVETQRLKGQLEEEEHRFSTKETEIDKSVKDLDFRMRDLESKFDVIMDHLSRLKAILEPKKSKTKSKDQKTGLNDITEYDKAVSIITKDKNFELAQVKLKKFIVDFPKSSLTDNAQYWLAESYYARGNFETATDEFAKVISTYPSSEKKCGALLKQGYSLENLGQNEKSTKVLKRILKDCPQTSEAKMALDKLKTKKRKVPRIVN